MNTILFNAAGLGILVFVAGYMVSSFFHVEEIPRCSTRFGNGVQFSLRNSEGNILSPLELQARLPSREWGMLTNARVVETQDKRNQFLQVSLGAQVGQEQSEEEEAAADEQNGVGFVWQPANLDKAKSACLSYRLFIPKDFALGPGGTLPGIYAASDIAALDAAELEAGFISRLAWQREGGALGIELRTPETAGMWLGARNAAWQPNKWVAIEHEVVLNTPGQSNGVIRVWIDGDLAVDSKNLNLGAKAESRISGIVADVGYRRGDNTQGRLTLSPFVIQAQ